MINFLLLLAVISWGFSFIGTKMALAYLSPSEIITVRFLLGLAVLLSVMKARNLRFRFRQSDMFLIIVVSVIFGFHVVLQAFGLIYTSATNTAWLIATVPVFIAITSRLALKEDLTKQKIFGIVAATFGVLLLISKGQLDNIGWLESVGDWIILFTCITWTIYTILTRNITREYNPLTVMIAVLTVPTVGLTLFTLSTSPLTKFMRLPPHIIFILIGLGVICAGLAQWIWLESLARKGALKAGVFIYLEPLVTTLAAMPILGEGLSIAGLFGAVLILFGVYLVERRPIMPSS